MSKSGAEDWPGDDAPNETSLDAVMRLAASPSATLVELTSKVAILVARLADEAADAGLCLAEA